VSKVDERVVINLPKACSKSNVLEGADRLVSEKKDLMLEPERPQGLELLRVQRLRHVEPHHLRAQRVRESPDFKCHERIPFPIKVTARSHEALTEG
jgi:hypothetical protein